MAKKSKSSRRWMQEHVTDPYVKEAQKRGYRSRAAFKLLEIQERDRLIKPGMVVVDLGAAPGGWSQVATGLVGERGRVIALDILPMDPLAGVEVLQGDFTQQDVLDRLLETLGEDQVDVVISDLAPNISGIKVSDQARSMYLAELALDFTREVLKPGGDFLVKLFQGAEFDAYIKEVRKTFSKVLIRKPKASRPRSKEVYLLARGRIV